MKIMNGLVKRGLIASVIAILGLLYELIFKRPLRTLSIILWLGVFAIGILIMISFKDSDQ